MKIRSQDRAKKLKTEKVDREVEEGGKSNSVQSC